jgi:hypothetical protein
MWELGGNVALSHYSNGLHFTSRVSGPGCIAISISGSPNLIQGELSIT